jgi:hypothetical protein
MFSLQTSNSKCFFSHRIKMDFQDRYFKLGAEFPKYVWGTSNHNIPEDLQRGLKLTRQDPDGRWWGQALGGRNAGMIDPDTGRTQEYHYIETGRIKKEVVGDRTSLRRVGTHWKINNKDIPPEVADRLVSFGQKKRTTKRKRRKSRRRGTRRRSSHRRSVRRRSMRRSKHHKF